MFVSFGRYCGGMDFVMLVKVIDYCMWLFDFMIEYVFGVEVDYDDYCCVVGLVDYIVLLIIEELKIKVKDCGLWNLFLLVELGLINLEYVLLVEMIGWSMEIVFEVFNCVVLDIGNMEILYMFGIE